jgi:hypothetical protein
MGQRCAEGEMNKVKHTPAPAPAAAKYYRFSQNNSGGSFVINDSVAHHVIIQAHSAQEANNRAASIGIYFDGCEKGRDCECCGDRWSAQWDDDDATDTPMIYGEPPGACNDIFTSEGKPVCHVYHLDGSKTTYIKEAKK